MDQKNLHRNIKIFTWGKNLHLDKKNSPQHKNLRLGKNLHLDKKIFTATEKSSPGKKSLPGKKYVPGQKIFTWAQCSWISCRSLWRSGNTGRTIFDRSRPTSK
jgi:hypothetical protein